MERLFIYTKGEFGDGVLPTGWWDADKNWNDTDAGTEDTFIVAAANAEAATDGARRWLSARGDDDAPNMPDGVYLEERVPDRRYARGYMFLRVL